MRAANGRSRQLSTLRRHHAVTPPGAARLNVRMRITVPQPATLAQMRPVLAAFTCVLALGAPLGLSACGGDERAYDAVPATTPELVPPDDANDIASGTTGPSGNTSTQPSTSDPSQTTTPGAGTGGTAPDANTGGATTPTPAPATGGTGGGAAPGTGGGAAPDTGGVSPDDTAAAGSVQQFCAENPGAC